MRILNEEEIVAISGAGGLDYFNDAAAAAGGALARAVDTVQTAIGSAISTAQAQMINAQFETQYR